MRTPLLSALVLLACGVAGGCADRSSRPSGAGAPPVIPAGPDPIVLRVPRGGGILTAVRYPALDSVVWRSSGRLPALARVLAFGAEDGYLAAADTAGAPVRVDLRVGTVSAARGDTVVAVSSADGGADPDAPAADDALSADDQALLDQAAQDLVAEMRSDMLRAQAELVNFRTRVERDRVANREAVIAEVLRVTRRYPSGTVRRILLHDLVGRSTSNHVASGEVERRGNEFRLR